MNIPKPLLVVITISITLFLSTPLFSQEILVKDINTSPDELKASNDYSELFCKCGEYLFFAVPAKELWRTDGTPEGTISLGDIRKGYARGFSGKAPYARALHTPSNRRVGQQPATARRDDSVDAVRAGRGSDRPSALQA